MAVNLGQAHDATFRACVRAYVGSTTTDRNVSHVISALEFLVPFLSRLRKLNFAETLSGKRSTCESSTLRTLPSFGVSIRIRIGGFSIKRAY